MHSHAGHEHHGHHHHGQLTGNILRWSLAATTLFVALEIFAGLRAHSLALLSDAAHNFTDALALFLAWYGFRLQSKPADQVKTFGYHRAGVLSAFVNAVTLVLLSGWIFYESIDRLRHPEAVHEWIMAAVASLGLILNGSIVLALRQSSKGDINVRAAFVHMLGDALGSLAIIAGAIAIHYSGWNELDPILSILIALLIVWSAADIIRESLNILLEGLPRGLSLNSVIDGMRRVEGVMDVHDLHIWSLGSQTHALSCHVLIADVPPSESDCILRALNEMLADQFQIHHTTVQFEHLSCAISETGCAIPTHYHKD